MAWEKIGTDVGVVIAAGTGTQSIALPGPPAIGDLVIVAIAGDISCADSIASSGYTVPDNEIGANPGANFGYKVLTTEETVVLINKNATVKKSCVVQVWRGGNASSILDQSYTTGTGSSANPNSPAIVTQNADALVFSIAFLDDDDATVSTWPTDYTNGKSANTETVPPSSTVGSTVAVCSKVIASPATEDPGAYTMSSADQWRAGTISFRIQAAEEHSGSGVISGNGALSATPKKGGIASSLISGAGALIVAAVIGLFGAGIISGNGSQVASGAKAATGIATISGGGSLTATGTAGEAENYEGTAAISGGGSLTASGVKAASSVGTISGGGSQSASGTKAISSAGVISASGSLVVSGEAGLKGDAAISGNGALTASGKASLLGSAIISGSGPLIASGQIGCAGVALISGGGTLTAAGSAEEVHSGSVVISGGGSLIGTGLKAGIGSASISGGGALTGEVAKQVSGDLVISGGGALVATGTKTEGEEHSGTALISGGGFLSATETRAGIGSGILSGGGSLVTTGEVSRFNSAFISGNGSLSATGIRAEGDAYFGIALISGGGIITAIGNSSFKSFVDSKYWASKQWRYKKYPWTSPFWPIDKFLQGEKRKWRR